jgi:hypothetical protein
VPIAIALFAFRISLGGRRLLEFSGVENGLYRFNAR